MNEPTPTISVIGAGAWGTALAQTIAYQRKDVTLWARTPALAAEINTAHENKPYLAGIELSHHITATSELQIAMQSEIILMVTPAQAMRKILEQTKPFLRTEHKFILCSKGIEISTGMLMSEVAQETLPDTPIAILSGPNFARDIAAGKPAATTLACTDEKTAETLQNAVASAFFRPYITNDIIGAQIAGALKNVIAIACGIAHGMEMGESARASLVTRGLAEIARLGHAMGADYETFLGLSGIGDIMLTCSSEQSRNFSFGLALGKGQSIDKLMENRTNVTEGVHTAKAIITLAKKHNTDIPISEAVHKCLHKGLPLDEALRALLNRPMGHAL